MQPGVGQLSLEVEGPRPGRVPEQATHSAVRVSPGTSLHVLGGSDVAPFLAPQRPPPACGPSRTPNVRLSGGRVNRCELVAPLDRGFAVGTS